MNFKQKVLHKIASIIRSSNLAKYCSLNNDKRKTTPFKLVYFCGDRGLNYLNASLISVFKHWKELPDVFIISDGTSVSTIRGGLVKWPKKVDIILWKECADYFNANGNSDLFKYACDELWGKKFAAIIYCAQKFPTLYTDSDILWFSYPNIDTTSAKPVLKMCEDISYCYSENMIEALNQQKVYDIKPLNAGLIYASGDFSGFDGWKLLTKYLKTNPDNRTEQTSFAILNNYFNPTEFFKLSEVIIKVDDEYGLRYSKTQFPDMLARHYVNKKETTFWRDFLFMFFRK